MEVIYADEDIWVTQKMMGLLYMVDVRTINYHLKNIFSDNELEENSVIQDFRITAADGKNYNTKHPPFSRLQENGVKIAHYKPPNTNSNTPPKHTKIKSYKYYIQHITSYHFEMRLPEANSDLELKTGECKPKYTGRLNFIAHFDCSL